MSFERFIAGRFMPRREGEGGFSGPLSAIAVASIALGVLVMVMAVSILRGFQSEITNKVSGFGSHLTVSNFVFNAAYQETPVVVNPALEEQMRAVPGVRHLQCYAHKGGMVKTEEQIYGIVLRGVSSNYDTSFFAQCLVEGTLPRLLEETSNEVLVSKTIATKLDLHVGDKMRTYFWHDDNYRARAFSVCGIYNTDLTEMDELYVIGDLRQVQRLNGWDSTMVGGYEILVDNMDFLDATAAGVLAVLPYDLNVQTIKQANPALFSWLDLLNSNIVLILTIMSVVCAIAIISALLIMIFEKSSTIGLLKALGANNASVRRIFLIKASGLILKGIAIGDAVSLLLCWVQWQWQVVKLDAESYSMGHVPVDMNPWIFLLVSVGALAVCMLALLLPAAYISHIHPAQTLKVKG